MLVTPEEEARLVQAAEAQRVTVPRLLIEAALTLHTSAGVGGAVGAAGATGAAGLAAGGVVTPTQRRDALAEMFAIRRLLAAVSNNVNQIARHANAGEEFPADAHATLQAVRRVVERLDDAMEKVAKV
ncbi:plasmid mobilization relaxosome protein MobC [Vallicoccus soli]|uniref:Plasmid mobilization relaxosome protein MobC n=1 Tax=Vallicoccus soli TaxID=2339232 RepID=A0A3A3ZBK5_9ACTN|nr:plasmid mobilization relaxosome protein MobC [Vallicoccus soli]